MTGCLILKQRCIKEKGECWPNIVHLPCMDINCDNLRWKVISLCSNLEGKFIQPYPTLTLIRYDHSYYQCSFIWILFFPLRKREEKANRKKEIKDRSPLLISIIRFACPYTMHNSQCHLLLDNLEISWLHESNADEIWGFLIIILSFFVCSRILIPIARWLVFNFYFFWICLIFVSSILLPALQSLLNLWWDFSLMVRWPWSSFLLQLWLDISFHIYIYIYCSYLPFHTCT